jgi:DNA polymerase V
MGSNNTTGFPSPAQGYEKDTFDFNRILSKHPSATFAMKYEGKTLTDTGLFPGDLIIVDSTIKPKQGMLGIVEEDGEFKCKRIEEKPGTVFGIITGIVRTEII